MRANEYGVRGPKANVTRLMSLRQVEIFNRVIGPSVANTTFIVPVPVIECARQEMVILERMAMDYATRNLPVIDSTEVFCGLSKHSRAMVTRLLDDMVNTAAWLGLQFFLEAGEVSVVFIRSDDHSEEELFEVIAKIPTQDNWEGWFFWLFSTKSDVNMRIVGRIEFTRIWSQRTFNTEYTRKGIAYDSGWKDSEWEESFTEDDT